MDSHLQSTSISAKPPSETSASQSGCGEPNRSQGLSSAQPDDPLIKSLTSSSTYYSDHHLLSTQHAHDQLKLIDRSDHHRSTRVVDDQELDETHTFQTNHHHHHHQSSLSTENQSCRHRSNSQLPNLQHSPNLPSASCDSTQQQRNLIDSSLDQKRIISSHPSSSFSSNPFNQSRASSSHHFYHYQPSSSNDLPSYHHHSSTCSSSQPGFKNVNYFLGRLISNTRSNVSLPTPNGLSFTRRSRSRPTQTAISLLILLSCLLAYLILISLLDQPNSLLLDPIIDPTTLLLRPDGDPYHLADLSSRPTRASIALSQHLVQREAGFHLLMQHVIHRNITTHLNSTVITQAIQFARQHLTDSEKKKKYKWYTPDSALIKNAPASRFHCDPQSSTVLFLGIFTTPAAFAKRNLIRTLFKPDLPSNGLIEFKFISGEPENQNWMELIKAEQSLHQDIVILKGVKDNIDAGKTYEYFKWITEKEKRRKNGHLTSDEMVPESERFRDDLGLNGWAESKQTFSVNDRDPRKVLYDKPKFVIKSDDDTFLVIPNLLKAFKNLDCQKNVYWGTSQGSSKLFDTYFRGLGYGLSWPLVEWIGSSNMSLESQVGIEDARVGAWLTDLDPVQDPLIRINEGWRMADWNQIEIDKNVIALHWIKETEWFPMLKLKILDVWKSANQIYKWDYFL